jgi:hypothetical protein
MPRNRPRTPLVKSEQAAAAVRAVFGVAAGLHTIAGALDKGLAAIATALAPAEPGLYANGRSVTVADLSSADIGCAVQIMGPGDLVSAQESQSFAGVLRSFRPSGNQRAITLDVGYPQGVERAVPMTTHVWVEARHA